MIPWTGLGKDTVLEVDVTWCNPYALSLCLVVNRYFGHKGLLFTDGSVLRWSTLTTWKRVIHSLKSIMRQFPIPPSPFNLHNSWINLTFLDRFRYGYRNFNSVLPYHILSNPFQSGTLINISLGNAHAFHIKLSEILPVLKIRVPNRKISQTSEV